MERLDAEVGTRSFHRWSGVDRSDTGKGAHVCPLSLDLGLVQRSHVTGPAIVTPCRRFGVFRNRRQNQKARRDGTQIWPIHFVNATGTANSGLISYASCRRAINPRLHPVNTAPSRVSTAAVWSASVRPLVPTAAAL